MLPTTALSMAGAIFTPRIERLQLRDCADWGLPEVVLLDRAGIPAVLVPDFFDESTQHDDGIGQRRPRGLDCHRPVQDHLQDPKAAGVPGIGAFDHPTFGVVDLDVGALG